MAINTKWHTLLTAILGVAVIVLCIYTCNVRKEKAEIVEIHSVANDSLRFTVNKLGQQEATIRVFEVSRERDFLNLETKDSTIKWLQSTVKAYKGKLLLASVVSGNTTDKGVTETDVVWDYITLVDSVPMEYKTSWNDKWSVGSIVANKDSIHRNIQVKNEWQETIGYGRWNPFKRRYLEINMLNLNPNTVSTEVRSVRIKMPEHRIGVGVYGGYGMTATVNGDLYHGFQLGIGVHYRIWP